MGTMSDAVRVLGVSGSLRKESFNTALLHTAIELAPPGMTITTAEIGDFPLFDDDIRVKEGFPEPVQRFREQIAACDGVLIATPEYNYSMPGPLKNAIDWASRPPAQPFAGKTLAIMGASNGLSGTVRVQYHLRQMAVFLDMFPLNKPEVFVRSAQEKVRDGKVVDEATRKVMSDQLVAFAEWTRRLRRG